MDSAKFDEIEHANAEVRQAEQAESEVRGRRVPLTEEDVSHIN